MLPRLNLLIKRQNSRNGKVGQPLAAVLLYGCCIPLAGKECARDYARRRVSERNRRKAALSAEITQEGIHRRLRPNGGYAISAVWEPSSKQARFIRHQRRFACFPALLKSAIFGTFISSENRFSGEKILFRHAETGKQTCFPVSFGI